MERIYYVGLDVDDKSFHGCVMDKEGKERFNFKAMPTTSALVKKLEVLKQRGDEIKICYEATYLGFSLQRNLAKRGYLCDVIAPTSIPRETGKSVKTDRVDSEELADYYRMGKLKVVIPPDEEDENIRDLLRSRKFLVDQMVTVKVHVLAILRRSGIHYREAAKQNRAAYWTKNHFKWLKERLSDSKEKVRFNLSRLLEQIAFLESQIGLYNERLEAVSKSPRYKDKVQALLCFRGIGTLTSLTLITELGDINRFPHPNQITSYAGMDIREYSSGGKECRFGISRKGNPHLRSVLVESSQFSLRPPSISRSLKIRRKDANPRAIEIADNCMRRLRKKACRMLYAGKHRNKIKVACAREMIGFIWEVLKEAA